MNEVICIIDCVKGCKYRVKFPLKDDKSILLDLVYDGYSDIFKGYVFLGVNGFRFVVHSYIDFVERLEDA